MASNHSNTILNDIEKEIILLKAVIEMINDMVNHEMLEVRGNSPDCSVYFNSITHMNYFYIILVDFLSKPDKTNFGIEDTYVDELAKTCNNPNFDQGNSIALLKQTVQEFKNWLEEEVIIERMWLPSIELEIDLKLQRTDFVKISGNIYKHNFTRLTIQAKKIKKLFENNGVTLNGEQSILILEDFHRKFDEDVLLYHNSTIVEFLNNLRWGIQEYLLPEYQNSCIIYYDDRIKGNIYKYQYPQMVVNSLAKKYYWELMNDIRSKPYVPKFVVWKHLKIKGHY